MLNIPNILDKLLRPAVKAGKDYVPGKPIEEVKREFGLTDVVKLASNENPLGASPMAVEAIVQELRKNVSRYPESQCVDLVSKLSGLHGVKPGQIFVDNGLDGVIGVLGLTFIDPGDEVIYGSITFPAYENTASKMGGVGVPVPVREDYTLDLPAMARAVTGRTKLIFVCNPNNPTGTVSKAAELEEFLRAVPEDVLVILDEAYYDFVDEPGFPDSISLLPKHKNAMVLRTFSKIMGLAGLRVGYAIADEEVVRCMFKMRQTFAVNRLAQAGALASLDDREFVAKSLEVNKAGRIQFYEAFKSMSLTFCPSQTNFVYVELGGLNSREAFQSLLREGVIVRPQQYPPRPDALRISIGTKEENARAIAALRKVIGK
jgi:histidinol-phosphate aminotransferase